MPIAYATREGKKSGFFGLLALGRLLAFDDFLRRGAFFEQFLGGNTPKGRRHPFVCFS